MRGFSLLDIDDDRIAAMRTYFHSLEANAELCREVGLPYRTNGYRFCSATSLVEIGAGQAYGDREPLLPCICRNERGRSEHAGGSAVQCSISRDRQPILRVWLRASVLESRSTSSQTRAGR